MCTFSTTGVENNVFVHPGYHPCVDVFLYWTRTCASWYFYLWHVAFSPLLWLSDHPSIHSSLISFYIFTHDQWVVWNYYFNWTFFRGTTGAEIFCRYKPCSIFTPSITIVVCNVTDNENCIPGHCFNIRKRRLFVRSREVSKPRDWQFVLMHRFEIRICWMASNCGIAE